MGFQGDVAGIGLGELLQGLARGGREGVLTLHGGGLIGTIGLQGGQVFLLPDPDEDPEIWRRRCERAWIRSPDYRVDHLRMSEIAYAHRMEQTFRLLDAENVHFRFEPGPLPTGQGGNSGTMDPDDDGTPRLGPEAQGAVHCPGLSVEFLLLEYARIQDEVSGLVDGGDCSDHVIPRVLDAGSPPQEMQRFWGECDGMSNIVEIADRLGWPLRQTKASLKHLEQSGSVRLASARELLVLAQKELGESHFARAASRLSGWLQTAEPGPPPVGDVQLLLAEWEKGRLAACLASMDKVSARRLLRRLDLVEQNWKHSIARWQELRTHLRHDTLTEVRLVTCRVRSGDEADAPTVNALLRLARTFQDAKRNVRAGVILRVAAGQQPETTSMRLELGQRMLSVGMVDDAAPWIIEACRTLVDSNLAEKAISPLRALISARTRHQEARQLLGQARSRSARGRRRRRNSIVALALLLMISSVALVQVRMEQRFNSKVGEVQSVMHQPNEALRVLEEHFGDDTSSRVARLRGSILDLLREGENERASTWNDRYRECMLECTLGDPLVGLRQSIDMPTPPHLVHIQQEWPAREALFTNLAAQLEQTVAEWEEPDEEILHEEQRFGRMLEDMVAMVEEHGADEEIAEFEARLAVLDEKLMQRSRQRDAKIHQREELELVEEQERLLTSARAHRTAGDFQRSESTYQRLFAMEGSEKLRRLLDHEFTKVQGEAHAERRALELAEEGRHGEATELLRENMGESGALLLPWWVRSHPNGAMARFEDGRVRRTPFRMFSALDEQVNFTLEAEGHDPLEVSIDRPGDLQLSLSRRADVTWPATSSVQAVPVIVQESMVLADRSGRLVSMDREGKVHWEKNLDSLGGIARAPVFMPRKPGHLLVLTEDGDTWFVEASTGELQGPWELDSTPDWGPVPTPDGVRAHFKSGDLAEWTTRLRPSLETNSPIPADDAHRHGADAGLRVLRNKIESANELESPGGIWTVEVRDELFWVRKSGDEAEGFAVRRNGQWSYVAWEAPRAGLRQGRLWVSDEAGLRAFEP